MEALAKPTLPMRPKPPTAVPLEVKTFEVLTVTELDECRQRFRAVVLLQLLVRDVDEDDPLRADEELDARGRVIFPKDESGFTFKPSAFWYMDQIETVP